jgi:SAM-dependent methyltransferase
MPPSEATTIDLDAVKSRQQEMWSSGDFSVVAHSVVLPAERIVDTADIRAGWRVLDVATGSGNAALAAARLGASVVGADYVPSLVERARERAAAERLDVEFVEGDAEALPFPDASFDAVTSVFGVMFAPNQERAAAELLRVVRPGGTIALVNWAPGGFIGGLLRVVGSHVPPPSGLRSPLEWGTEERLRELLDAGVSSLEVREQTCTFRSESARGLVAWFRRFYGPTLKAFAALDDEGRKALTADLVALVEEHDRLDGPQVAVPSAYVEVVATRA